MNKVVTNLSMTPLSVHDHRGRSVVISPQDTKVVSLSQDEISALNDLVDKKLVRIEDPISSRRGTSFMTNSAAFFEAPFIMPDNPPSLLGPRTIKVAPGIGDILWLVMKLEATKEKFDWVIAADQPQRGHQIFEILPQTVASVTYDRSFNAIHALNGNIQSRLPTWKEIGNRSNFYLTINHHFEAVPAYDFKDWLPDLPVNYYPDYQTQPFVQQANRMLSDKNAKYIGCYGSSYSSARHWGGWQEDKWEDLILKLRQRDPSIVPIIIGAEWDIDIATNLIKRLDARQIPYIRLIGEKLGLVVEIMRRIRYGFYFPSGIGIIGGTLGVPGTMWYPPHLRTMMGKWCDPKLTEQGIFHETEFNTPDDMIKYIDGRGGIK